MSRVSPTLYARHVRDELHRRIHQVVKEHSSSSVSRSPQAFGFYWTRKNSELARRLVSEFTGPQGVVLDPFLGAGSSAIGTASSAENRLFVGVEVNEMPLENLRLTLGSVTDLAPDDLYRLEELLESIRDLYIFQTTAGIFEVQKIIHTSGNSALDPIAFVGTLGGVKSRVSNREHPSIFRELRKSYLARSKPLKKRDNAPLAENSRIAVKAGMQVSDVFGPLGFEALSVLREHTRGSLLFRLLIGASLHLCRLTDRGSQSQFPFWFPKENIHEKSVFEVVSKKLGELVTHIELSRSLRLAEIVPSFSSWRTNHRTAALLLKGSASRVLRDELPDESVDLVLTDPPYFDQVPYGEYLKLWEHFTGFASDLDAEIVESSRVGSDRSRTRFLDDLSAAFFEVRKKMKPSSLMLVYFKDSKPKNLHDFIFCLERAGLVFETQVHISKQSFTYKQNSSQENTVGGDSIMVFSPGNSRVSRKPTSEESIEKLDELFVSLFAEYLDTHGPSTLTEALDNSLIRKMYPTGYLSLIKSSSHFNKLISHNFVLEKKTRRWRKAN